MSLPPDFHVSFIGGGAMATAIASGIGAAKLVPYSQMSISDIRTDTPSLRQLSSKGVRVEQHGNRVVASRANVLILATKPDVLLPVLRELDPASSSCIKPDTIIVSIAAGLKLSQIEAVLPPRSKVIRTMPNTPMLVGCGACAYALGSNATKEDGEIVQKLLESIGLVVRVAEKDLDGVTGLSGSGPAFVFLFLEALMDGGVRAGLSREVATKLAAQTVMGAAKMVLEAGKHPAQLKDQVTSPGGTTIAGVHALESRAFRGIVMNAVVQAAKRAKELGQMNSNSNNNQATGKIQSKM